MISFRSKNSSVSLIATILLGLILPWILILPISFLGGSEIIEEIFKTLVIFCLVVPAFSFGKGVIVSVAFGFTFALSEAALYMPNLYTFGGLEDIYSRLIWVGLLHIVTSLIIFCLAKYKKWLVPLGFILALTIHLIYNLVLVKYLVATVILQFMVLYLLQQY